jgi:hypothetical protein
VQRSLLGKKYDVEGMDSLEVGNSASKSESKQRRCQVEKLEVHNPDQDSTLTKESETPK